MTTLSAPLQIFILFIFISIFILLICRQAAEVGGREGGGRASNYFDLLSKMQRYCCPLEIFISVF